MANTTNIWQCPKCGKEFAKQNQSHKCEIVAIETLFQNKDPKLLFIYKLLLKKLSRPYKETTSSKAITLYTEKRKAFLGITVKRSFLDIWFVLGRNVDEFPVYKIVQPSKNRHGHFVRLYEKQDVDDFLLRLIEEGYDFMS